MTGKNDVRIRNRNMTEAPLELLFLDQFGNQQGTVLIHPLPVPGESDADAFAEIFNTHKVAETKGIPTRVMDLPIVVIALQLQIPLRKF